MINLLLLIPLIGSLLILFVKEENTSKYFKDIKLGRKLSDIFPFLFDNNYIIKDIALITSLINLFISLFIWFNFDFSTNNYQFVSEWSALNFLNFTFGIDGISIYFVLLTTFVTPIAILSNYHNINENTKLFFTSFLILETLQICVFVSLDLLLFYIFFESVLPVIFVIILIFGHGMDKFRSAFLFFLYTLAGSLPMLLSILVIYSYFGSTDFQIISLKEISLESQKVLWIGFFLALAAKTPLYPVTIWLPKAHSDSPLAGSVILAGTILKLATYGYLRVLINILPDATHYFTPIVLTICIISIVYASLSTIIQQDTKKLIAYSSIAHMGVVVLGIFSNTVPGIEGAILLGIAHGFVSPALFIMVGGVIYDRVHTRIINYIRGLVTYMPVSTLFFLLFTLANIGTPISLNYLGEQLSLIGIFERNPIIAVLGATSIGLSACYSIYLYNRLSYGVYSPHLEPVKDLNRREFNILLALLIPTIFFGIKPGIILDSLHITCSYLLYSVV